MLRRLYGTAEGSLIPALTALLMRLLMVHPRPDPMISRDFVGYGEHPPDPEWPGNAKIAVNFLIAHALQALAESITLLERYGLDTGQFADH